MKAGFGEFFIGMLTFNGLGATKIFHLESSERTETSESKGCGAAYASRYVWEKLCNYLYSDESEEAALS